MDIHEAMPGQSAKRSLRQRPIYSICVDRSSINDRMRPIQREPPMGASVESLRRGIDIIMPACCGRRVRSYAPVVAYHEAFKDCRIPKRTHGDLEDVNSKTRPLDPAPRNDDQLRW
jgi:hypothetical protein